MVSQFCFSLFLVIPCQFCINSLQITSHHLFIEKIIYLWNSVFLRIALHDRFWVGVNNGRPSIFPRNQFCNICHGKRKLVQPSLKPVFLPVFTSLMFLCFLTFSRVFSNTQLFISLKKSLSKQFLLLF